MHIEGRSKQKMQDVPFFKILFILFLEVGREGETEG